MKKQIGLSFLCVAGLLSSTANGSVASTDSPVQYTFTEQVQLAPPSGSYHRIRVWIPAPSDTPEQKILKTEVESPLPYRWTHERRFGNRMLYLELDPSARLPATVKITYQIQRSAAHDLRLADLKEMSHWDPKSFLSSDRKIPLDGEILALSKKLTRNLKSTDQKISTLYKYVTRTMVYNKDGTGWGQGDAIWACDNKRGNCTDFHSLLIGLARSQRIPGRFEIGFPIPSSAEGAIPGYHCWARLYSPREGWVPMDASEAKKSGKTAEYFGHLPADRIQFTTGRDIRLEPKQDGQDLNYFVYPYSEVDGHAAKAPESHFHFKRG